jgi:hypothetical protein
MIKTVFLLLVIPILISAQSAPYFPLVSQSFDSNIKKASYIDAVFNPISLSKPDQIGVAIAHQNREWDYNWFVFGFVYPSDYGSFGLGYSNYSSTSIPVTSDDTVTGPYISSYEADVFETLAFSYSPILSEVDITVMINYKERRLINKTASSFYVDLKLSSPKILNNRIGILTQSLLGSNYYKWDNGDEEALPQYVGVYYIHPFDQLMIKVQADICTNYSELTTSSAALSYSVDKYIRLYFSAQTADVFNIMTFGLDLSLSDVLSLSYSNRNESNDYEDLDIHAIGIGVTF